MINAIAILYLKYQCNTNSYRGSSDQTIEVYWMRKTHDERVEIPPQAGYCTLEVAPFLCWSLRYYQGDFMDETNKRADSSNRRAWKQNYLNPSS